MNNDFSKVIDGCLKHDPVAQRELYRFFAPKMMAVCRRYVPDVETAKDVLQEGFVTLFDKIGSYKGDGSFEGWV